jgi:preprotein translocase subunit SecE
MNVKADTTVSNKVLDTFKWLFFVVILSAGIFGFYFFEEHSLLLRVVSLLAVMGVAVFIASTTEKGRNALGFVREAQIEVRKVVWPSRQETLQVTAIVIGMVVLVAIMVWLFDSILMWLVKWLTGYGG